MEKLMYEARPYLYVLMGLFGLVQAKFSPLLISSAALLLFSGVYVGKLRWVYRRNLDVYIKDLHARPIK
jgi:hypothetical protein